MSEPNERQVKASLTSEGLLPVSPGVIRYLIDCGMTEAEAVRGAFRLFRPGGPLDDANYLTRCCTCRTNKCQTLRWFHEREFSCECGGKFDDRPLHAFNEAIAKCEIGKAKRIFNEFFQPFEHAEH